VAPDFNPWANSENILSFTPFLLYPPLFTRSHPFQTVEAPPFSLSHLSQNPWRFEVSNKGRHQDWKQEDLSRPLFTIPLEFFGFLSSSSLQRYSNLHFARSPYMVQRFEFPLVEHLLRSPRRHTYKSIRFR
jgi:hypothetical protein